jgi:hypothetical protein
MVLKDYSLSSLVQAHSLLLVRKLFVSTVLAFPFALVTSVRIFIFKRGNFSQNSFI